MQIKWMLIPRVVHTLAGLQQSISKKLIDQLDLLGVLEEDGSIKIVKSRAFGLEITQTHTVENFFAEIKRIEDLFTHDTDLIPNYDGNFLARHGAGLDG